MCATKTSWLTFEAAEAVRKRQRHPPYITPHIPPHAVARRAARRVAVIATHVGIAGPGHPSAERETARL